MADNLNWLFSAPILGPRVAYIYGTLRHVPNRGFQRGYQARFCWFGLEVKTKHCPEGDHIPVALQGYYLGRLQPARYLCLIPQAGDYRKYKYKQRPLSPIAMKDWC